ncbi:MAG: hypothetical protein ACI4XC_03010 [Eubacterium sp.]
MKNKFFRIISPVTLSVVIVLDAAIVVFAAFSVKKLLYFANFYAILFAICEVFALVMAVLVTKDVVTQGIKFGDTQLEFTHIDTDNVFSYDEILNVETQRDSKASLVKNFRDRQSKIILNLTDDRVITVDIGITTEKALKAAADEIISHLPERPEISDSSQEPIESPSETKEETNE